MPAKYLDSNNSILLSGELGVFKVGRFRCKMRGGGTNFAAKDLARANDPKSRERFVVPKWELDQTRANPVSTSPQSGTYSHI